MSQVSFYFTFCLLFIKKIYLFTSFKLFLLEKENFLKVYESLEHLCKSVNILERNKIQGVSRKMLDNEL